MPVVPDPVMHCSSRLSFRFDPAHPTSSGNQVIVSFFGTRRVFLLSPFYSALTKSGSRATKFSTTLPAGKPTSEDTLRSSLATRHCSSLSPIIPTHTSGSPVSLIIPTHTQKPGGRGVFASRALFNGRRRSRLPKRPFPTADLQLPTAPRSARRHTHFGSYPCPTA